MAGLPSITRRAALVGAFFSSLALGVPAAAAVKPVFVKVGSPTLPEEPYSRLYRLAKELGRALHAIRKHPKSPSDWVAFIQPNDGTEQYTSAFMDADAYADWQARTITLKQAEAIAAWRLATIETKAAWDGYSAGTTTRSEWERTNFVRHDAMDEMHKALSA